VAFKLPQSAEVILEHFAPHRAISLMSSPTAVLEKLGTIYSAFESPAQSYVLVTNAPSINIDPNNHAAVVHIDKNFPDSRGLLAREIYQHEIALISIHLRVQDRPSVSGGRQAGKNGFCQVGDSVDLSGGEAIEPDRLPLAGICPGNEEDALLHHREVTPAAQAVYE
jgi:hypothetical protein